MIPNKAIDMLFAEILGDVRELIDQVAGLKGDLPNILNQMQTVFAARTAMADELQEPIQRAIQSYIRQELQGIRVAVKEAKHSAVHALEADISVAVGNKVNWVQFKCEKSFDAAAIRFDCAVTESAKAAESRATETLKGLCEGLKIRIDEIRAERWRGQYLSMLSACIFSGLAVGILAVYILK